MYQNIHLFSHNVSVNDLYQANNSDNPILKQHDQFIFWYICSVDSVQDLFFFVLKMIKKKRLSVQQRSQLWTLNGSLNHVKKKKKKKKKKP